MRIALLVLAWGSTFTAVAVGVDHAPPLLFGGMRSVIGGLLMAALALARHGPPDLRRTWRSHAVLTWWQVVAFFTLQTLALEALPSGLAAVLIYLQPLLVALLAWWLLGESMGTLKVAGLVTGFLGIVLVSTGALDGRISGVGVLYAVLGAVCWAIGTIVFKQHQHLVQPWWAVAIPFCAGGAVLTAVGAVVEGTSIRWDGAFVAALAWSSLVGTCLAWGLWLGLVASGEPGRAAAYIFTVPVVAVVLGVLFLDEQFHPVQVAGSALVVAGLFLVNRRVSPPAVAGTAAP